MKLTLLESSRTPLFLHKGVVASFVAHATIIGAAVVATNPPAVAPDRPADERVTYLIPFDKLPKKERPQQEVVQWVKHGPGGGNEGVLQGQIDKAAKSAASIAGKGPKAGGEPTIVPPSDDWTLGDTVLTVLEVDSAVVRDPTSAAPAYPASMLARQLEGLVHAQYVVDTLGVADTSTFKVLDSTHPDFTVAVREALPLMRFRPAIVRSHRVRQLVEQSFTFKIQPPVETAKAKKTVP